MKADRLQRVAALLETEVGTLLQRELSQIDGLLVSVTRVRVSPDLSVADVFITPVDPGVEPGHALNHAKKVLPRVQRGIAERVELRRTPHLRLRIDEGKKVQDRLDQLFAQIRAEQPGN